MKSIKLAVIGTIVMGTMVVGGNAFAADVGTRNTDAQVIFEESTDIVDPVDPLAPSKPVIPKDPINPGTPVKPGTSGPLSLDYASSLNFGKQKITSIDQTYFAAPQTVTDKDGKNSRTTPLYAQVTDNRGTVAGWSLSVKQNSQFKAGTDELTGAKIEFLNGQVATDSISTVPSIVKPSFDLTADGNGAATNIIGAKKNEGAGTFVYRFGDDTTKAKGVSLSVPGKTIKKKDVAYKTTLTWTLSDVPGV
ncbi:Cell surface protein [Carnobacterium maltaromaticum]|uniref:WxL domain-containing protein n=1 Tax=Carnobacterium maltaromaticum TaxID=2751 RepID=UPI00191BAE0B|nr:WxL domain-containing protein [Carnobacterium maltaromaticum]CAD5896741.1 Cell surface protein [Carnobacterium maltaromaticum]